MAQPGPKTWRLPSEDRRLTHEVKVVRTTTGHLAEYNRVWLPELLALEALDLDFPWSQDFQREAANPDFEMVSLVDESARLYGLMGLRHLREARVGEVAGLVHVEHLAVVPSGRPVRKPRSILGAGGVLLE